MKQSNAFDILARQDALTPENWINLVEARARLIKNSLHDMTLPTLGELRLIFDSGGGHTINDDAPTLVTDSKFSLETRGIFPREPDSFLGVKNMNQEVINKAEGSEVVIYSLWGLSRDAEWLKIKIRATLEGWSTKIQRAKVVEISPASPTDICSFCSILPIAILRVLGEHVEQWEDQREKLYKKAGELRAQIAFEDLLRDQILTKGLPSK